MRRSVRFSGEFLLLCAVLYGGADVGAQSLEEAQQLYSAGRLTEAIDVYREVAAASEKSDPATAGTARNNACVLLMRTGALDDALPDCREALRLRELAGDTTQSARAQNNLGLLLQYLARYEEAEDHFHEALALNRTIGDAEGEAINWANLGAVAIQAGWYTKAIDAQRRVLELARQHADAPWAAQQVTLARINEAVVLERLGAYREALALYDEVLEVQDTIEPRQRSALLVNLGVVYRNLGDPVRAVEAFELAIDSYERLGDKAALSNAWLNVGLVRHLNLEQPAAAEQAYREALRLATESGDRPEEIQDLYYLGRLLLDLGRPDEAETLFLRCSRAAEESGSSEGLWASHDGLARIARSRRDLAGALQSSLEAIAEIEKVRDSLPRTSLRAGYFGDKRQVYLSAIEVLAELHALESEAGHGERALELVQQAKARVLLDALGPAARRGTPQATRALVDSVGDGTLLEYFVGEDRLLMWSVRRGRIELYELGQPGPILDRVTEVYAALKRGDEPRRETVRTLSEDLLPGAASWLSGTDRVYVAPDGWLQRLPFELLLTPGPSGEPLVLGTTLRYLPSGSVLSWLRPANANPGWAVIGIGDPRGAADDSATPTATDLLVARFDLGSLRAAASELAMIERVIPGEKAIRTGVEATEEAFAGLAARGSRVVHLVSHTIIDEKSGRGSAILLSPGEASDGLFYPQEIAELDYPVDLTVLAACRTALGESGNGNALATLTGSFLAAGSSAVVATLWDVGDEATAAFMEQFYHQLGRGHAPAVALRNAKKRLLADPQWSRSNLWAAYILVGEAGPVVPGGRFHLWSAGGAALVVGLLFWLGSRYVRRRSPGTS